MVAKDAALVDSLQSFNDMQELRHGADYDHGRRFSRLHLVEACESARLARRRLGDASSAAREALFTLPHGAASRLSPAVTVPESAWGR